MIAKVLICLVPFFLASATAQLPYQDKFAANAYPNGEVSVGNDDIVDRQKRNIQSDIAEGDGTDATSRFGLLSGRYGVYGSYPGSYGGYGGFGNNGGYAGGYSGGYSGYGYGNRTFFDSILNVIRKVIRTVMSVVLRIIKFILPDRIFYGITPMELIQLTQSYYPRI